MSKYTTPGVYIEEKNAFPHSVVQVATAVPVFIGYTEKAMKHEDNDLLGKPLRISSWSEYVLYFGVAAFDDSLTVTIDAEGKVTSTFDQRTIFLLYYSMQFFFQNGGSDCYIISVGSYDKAMIDVDDLQNGLEIAKELKAATIVVFPDATNLPSAKQYYDVHKLAMQQAYALKDRFVVMDVWMDPTNAAADNIGTLRNADIGDVDRAYGAAYYPQMLTNIQYHLDESKLFVTALNDENLSGTLEELGKKNRQLHDQVRLSFPKMNLRLPVAAAIAGVYTLVDNSRGVWKAPANVALNGVLEPLVKIDNNASADLNISIDGKSINVIRTFPGQGVLVWGARTLDGNSQDWKYVNVRRTFIMIETSIKLATQAYVFEPNVANTWITIKSMLSNFLTNLWKQGALAGAKSEESFAVQCGLGQTMTATDILEGRLVVTLLLAMLRPAEFISITFSQQLQHSKDV